MDSKICNKCKENKEIIKDFYKAYANVYASSCKSCQNKRRTTNYQKKEKIYKEFGFEKLDEETKQNIKKDLKKGLKFVRIAKNNNVPYHSLLIWKKKF